MHKNVQFIKYNTFCKNYIIKQFNLKMKKYIKIYILMEQILKLNQHLVK